MRPICLLVRRPTFTHDLHAAVAAAQPELETFVAAMNDSDRTYDYPAAVKFQVVGRLAFVLSLAASVFFAMISWLFFVVSFTLRVVLQREKSCGFLEQFDGGVGGVRLTISDVSSTIGVGEAV